MRLERVRMRGLGPFRDEVSLDTRELGDATLVAVCGDNGEGKSTFLEFALPGAFYRTTPTQGSLRDRATARDALLEVVVTGAETHTIRHLVDGTSGKGESVVLDHAGKPVSGSTKVSDFDAWSATHLPPEAVLLASSFGAQQDRGFLGATPSDRKAILLRALGIARYEAWAAAASKHAAACKQALEVTRARIADAQRSGGDVSQFSTAFEAAKEDAMRLDGELATARATLADVEARARDARDAAAAQAAHAAKQADLRGRLQALEAKRDDVEARISACTRTLGQESEIRSAAASLEATKAQLDELLRQRTGLTSRQEAAQERARAAKGQADDARRHQDRVAVRISDLEQVIAQGAEIAQAESDLREIERGLPALRDELRQAQATLDELTSATVAGAEERVAGLRHGLEIISSSVALQDATELATGYLEADDAVVLAASERPAKLQAARRAVEATRTLIASAEHRQRQRMAVARRAGELQAARQQMAGLREELSQHAAASGRHDAAAKEAAAQAQAAASKLEELESLHGKLLAQAEKHRPLADQLPHIALAASKLEERKAQRVEIVGDMQTLTRKLELLGPGPEPVAVPDPAPQRSLVEQLDRAARAAHQAAAVAASQLEAARKVAQQLAELQEKQRAEETELSDWARLAADLGRQGLQAAEIDSCGPELTALVNDLLHSAHGPRFTVRIDTQLASADGKKTLEGCRVTVIDTVRGREDEGAKFSGGERVIIGEALALGLSMLACQRSGLRGITLVRDETGAALDPGNAEVYVRMLRRAAHQIGAERVFFVCHNPEISDLADARLTIANGRLLIDAPAGRVAA